MKTKDFILILVIILVLGPFFIFDSVYQGYVSLNAGHPYFLAFVKFAILSTLGEALNLRIRTGEYSPKNYGLLPRAILWGLFGIWIAVAMKIFASGTPVMAESLGIKNAPEIMRSAFTPTKVLVAFMVSVMMNTIFAPIFMTLHKITDTHILNNGGKLSSLLKPIDMAAQFKEINWNIQWGFVFKKTIPLFWFPAHTITFLLPAEFQVLFAALLSIALGLILSIAASMSRKK